MAYQTTTFKEWQISKSTVDCCSSIERFLTTKCRTLGLLQLILPIGWTISKKDSDKKRWIERTFQTSVNSLTNLYMSTKNNKVHIYQYYPADFNSDFTVIRLNVIVDDYDRIFLV